MMNIYNKISIKKINKCNKNKWNFIINIYNKIQIKLKQIQTGKILMENFLIFKTQFLREDTIRTKQCLFI